MQIWTWRIKQKTQKHLDWRLYSWLWDTHTHTHIHIVSSSNTHIFSHSCKFFSLVRINRPLLSRITSGRTLSFPCCIILYFFAILVRPCGSADKLSVLANRQKYCKFLVPWTVYINCPREITGIVILSILRITTHCLWIYVPLFYHEYYYIY